MQSWDRSGRNIAAGMTGGVLFLHDVDTSVKAHVSASAPAPKRLGDEDAAELKAMIEAHVARTDSRTRLAELLYRLGRPQSSRSGC